jgi:hypothetical protein
MGGGGDNVKTSVAEAASECMDWNYVAQDGDHWSSLVDTLMNPWVL